MSETKIGDRLATSVIRTLPEFGHRPAMERAGCRRRGSPGWTGRATALLLGRCGARVGLLGRDAEPLGETAASMDAEGMILPADISDDHQVRNACERLMRAWATIDGVFANAGINGVRAPIEELDCAEWDRTISVNLTGTYLTIR